MKFTFKKNADSSADGDGNIEQQLLPKSRSFSSKSNTSDDARSMKKSKTMNKKATNDAPHRGGDAGVISVKTAAPVSSKMSAERLAQKARGDSLVHKADATEGKSSWFSFAMKELSQKKDNQAVLLLKKAAGAYTLAGCDDEAGKAYQRAADIYKDRLQNKVEASRCLTDAGEVLKKTNSAESTKCYQSAVTLLVEAGKLNDVVSMGLQNQSPTEAQPTEKKMSKKTAAYAKSDVKKMKSSKKASTKSGVWKDSTKASGGENQKKSGLFKSFTKQ